MGWEDLQAAPSHARGIVDFPDALNDSLVFGEQ